MKFAVFFISLFGLSNTVQASTFWDMNNASILLPLPQDARVDPILLPTTSAAGGELFPKHYLELLPPLGLSASSTLSVVAIRIDPCFPSIPAPGETCYPVIRMVWQPLIEDASGISAEDAAAHTFYELTKEEFQEFSQKLAALNENSGVPVIGLPLQVHPAIARQGLRGNYWSRLRSLLLAYTGEARIKRFTFMSLETPNTNWTFGGFEVNNGRAKQVSIVRVNTPLQAFVNTSADSLGFVGGPSPEPPENQDNFNRIMERSSILTAGEVPLLKASADSIFRIENPRFNSPDTIDCASCHAAQSAQMFEEKGFPDLQMQNNPHRFLSSFNLTNLTAPQYALHHVVRAFGYQGREPVIAQVTINQTASVAESLNHMALSEVRKALK